MRKLLYLFLLIPALLSADQKFLVPIDMNSNKVKNVGTPTVSTDATTKAYVDSSVTTHGDSAYTILSTDKNVFLTTALTTTRTWTLPLANSVTPGYTIRIGDLTASLTAPRDLVIARAGSDVIYPPGGTSTALNTPYEFVTFVSDGVSKWILSEFNGGDPAAQNVFIQGGANYWGSSTYALPAAAGASGNLWISDGSNMVSVAMSGEATINSSGVLSLTNDLKAGGKTADTTINDTVTYTTGGITYAAPAIASGQIYRVKAMGNIVGVSSATARNAQAACFWGSTQLTAAIIAFPTSTARTVDFNVEFILTGTSTTAIWTTGSIYSPLGSLAANNSQSVSGTTTVTSGAQTLDLRFSMSAAVATDQWVIKQVTMERLK